ncbi:hypothetical protein AB0M36_14520 [Actinoplanes sp. NPDC051346]|uniref:hypothetical protein n=1 Tax=Actinoplanes sp. NPDC051346 TaxID=3155048 RepID=UPI003428D899
MGRPDNALSVAAVEGDEESRMGMGNLSELWGDLDGARLRDVHVPGYLETAHGTVRFEPFGAGFVQEHLWEPTKR